MHIKDLCPHEHEINSPQGYTRNTSVCGLKKDSTYVESNQNNPFLNKMKSRYNLILATLNKVAINNVVVY